MKNKSNQGKWDSVKLKHFYTAEKIINGENRHLQNERIYQKLLPHKKLTFNIQGTQFNNKTQF